MSKVIFIPVSVAGGLLAALTGKKLFNVIWEVVDDEDAPKRAPNRRLAGRRSARFTMTRATEAKFFLETGPV